MTPPECPSSLETCSHAAYQHPGIVLLSICEIVISSRFQPPPLQSCVTCSPLAASRTMTVLSADPDSTCSPEGLHATLVTPPACPSSLETCSKGPETKSFKSICNPKKLQYIQFSMPFRAALEMAGSNMRHLRAAPCVPHHHSLVVRSRREPRARRAPGNAPDAAHVPLQPRHLSASRLSVFAQAGIGEPETCF